MAILLDNQQQEIKHILEAEIEGVHLLLQLLEQEYELLAGHHADTLEDVVSNKLETIQQLESITRQREKLLASCDSVIVNEDQNKNKHYQFNNRQLADLWDNLVHAAEKCRDKNRVNGSTVELVSRQSRHALDILHGIVADGSTASEVYDNAGQTRAVASKRSLVHV